MGAPARTPAEFKKHFFSKIKKGKNTGDCWIWQGSVSGNGYGAIRDPSLKKQEPAHRVSVRLSGKKIPEGILILHRCDNTLCVNPEHLFFGTQADNMQDCLLKGRKSPPPRRVVKNGFMVPVRAVLDPEKVKMIRKLLKNETIAHVARVYGVGESTIRHIKKGKTWVGT